MLYRREDVIQRLKAERDALGMSQRALSARSGLTQAHISQIERGAIDPGLSSLIELARSLDLEIALVPKKLVPAVESIIAAATMRHADAPLSTQAAEVARFMRLVKAQRQLNGSSVDLDRIEDSLRVLRIWPMRPAELTAVKRLQSLVRAGQADPKASPDFQEIAVKLQGIRDGVAHRDVNEPRPAYVFEDEADDA